MGCYVTPSPTLPQFSSWIPKSLTNAFSRIVINRAKLPQYCEAPSLRAPVVLLVNKQKETCVNRHLRSTTVFFGGSLSRRSRRRNITATAATVRTKKPPTDKNTVRMTSGLPKKKKRGYRIVSIHNSKTALFGKIRWNFGK